MPKQSARVIGMNHGLTAVEMNLLLKEKGLLDGEQGRYSVTEKGKQYASETYHQLAPAVGYDGVIWDPSVTAQLDITDERKQQVREEARALRQQRAELRAAQAVVLDVASIDDGGADGSGVDPRVVVVGLVVVTALAIYGIKKAVTYVKKRRADTTAQPLEVEEPDAGDTGDHSEVPDSDEDSLT